MARAGSGLDERICVVDNDDGDDDSEDDAGNDD